MEAEGRRKGCLRQKGSPPAAAGTERREQSCPNITKAIARFKSVCLAVHGWHTAGPMCPWHMFREQTGQIAAEGSGLKTL